MQEALKKAIESEISASVGYEIKIKNVTSISGGCINDAIKIETNKAPYFVKWNSDRFDKMFEAEKKGLELLKNPDVIDVPQVICSSETTKNTIFIVLEWIEASLKKSAYWSEFGINLAKLHKVNHELYGLDHDNYIGSLVQFNKQNDNWINFFIEQRIEKQIETAFNKNLLSTSQLNHFQNLYNQLENIFPVEPASLLHGDLWSGNVITNNKGSACIIDPAVYFGNREMELAFTTLFGGFDPDFYKAYHETYPLEPGFQNRKDIYNLYPLLVHLNLFGNSYLGGIIQIIKKF